MKKRILFGVFLATLMETYICLAEDVTNTAGVIYSNATVFKVEPDGITYKHSNGWVKLNFEDLQPDIQTKFNYDPEAAAIYQNKKEEAQKKAQEENDALRDKAKQTIKPADTKLPPSQSVIKGHWVSRWDIRPKPEFQRLCDAPFMLILLAINKMRLE